MVILPMPRVTPNPQMTYFCYIWPSFVSQVRVKLDTVNLIHLLIIENRWQPMTCCTQDPGKAWPGSRDHLKFWQKVTISQVQLATYGYNG